jgi:hypothetical protein
MRTPFQDALQIYTERYGRPPSREIERMLTGRQRVFSDTVSSRHAALFLLAHTNRLELPTVIFGPLCKMSRFERELEALGQPEGGGIPYCWERRPWIPSELALVYRSDMNPIYTSWAIWLK